MRVPWTARRPNLSILKEISPEYSLEELMMKLKLQYFGHLMQRADLLGKTLMLGKTEGRQKEEGATEDEMARSITDSMDMNFSKPCKILEDRRTWPAAVHWVAKSQT